MRSIFDPTARAELQRRLRTLGPGATARWGKMSAHQMLCHIGDQMRVALGDLPTSPTPIFLRNRVLRMLYVHLLPWPRGAPTAREMLSTQPETWQADMDRVAKLLDRFSRTPTDWPEHPAFGRLSTREWGWLVYRHTDHHLRQFGA